MSLLCPRGDCYSRSRSIAPSPIKNGGKKALRVLAKQSQSLVVGDPTICRHTQRQTHKKGGRTRKKAIINITNLNVQYEFGSGQIKGFPGGSVVFASTPQRQKKKLIYVRSLPTEALQHPRVFGLGIGDNFGKEMGKRTSHGQ